MSSANSTLEVDDGNSTTEQESLPTTTSVLDKSRSLFGNSSSALATPQRDPTPDAQSGETSAVANPVAMEAEVTEQPAAGETLTEATPVEETPTEVEMQEAQEEPMDSAEPPAEDNGEDTPKSEKSEEPEAIVEEVFDKKVVSMDTSRDDEEGEAVPAEEPMDTEDGVQEEMEGDNVDAVEDDEDEAPKKKAKRAVVASEDDEVSKEVEEPEEENGEAEEAESKEKEAAADQEDAPKESPLPDTVQSEESDEASLVIDESACKSVESFDAPEDSQAVEAESVEEHAPEEQEEAAAEEELKQEHVEEEEELVQEQVEEEKEEPETSSRRSRGRKSTGSAPTPSPSTARRGRGRASQTQKEVEEDAEEGSSTPRKGRSSRGKKEEVSEDVDETPNEPVEEEAAETTSPKKGRSRRSAPVVEKDEEEGAPEAGEELVEDQQQEEEAETPKRGGRARRSAAAATPSTPRSTRRGRKSNATAEDPEPAAEEVDTPAKKTRTPRGKKAAEAAVEEPEDEDNEQQEEAEEAEAVTEESGAPTSSRRSTRAKATPKAASSTPASATKRTPARGSRKKQVSLTEEVIEEGEETAEATPPAKKARVARSAPSSSKKKDEYDPYDMDTEMEHHPEPLKNIQMEVKNFGAITYAKVGSSESKYSSTEKAAESRIGDLHAGSSAKARRSLADMTPGKEKVKHRMSYPSSARRSKAKKDEPEDVEMEEEEQPTSSAAPPSTNRGKKRKSEVMDAVTPAKKQVVPQLPKLDDEQQLKVDHPNDDNEPHAPGARVYANFQKTFYPALILSERDGLGRYKLQFTADNVVKDVPNSGIVRLRDVTPGKLAIYEEGDVRIDVGVDDISAATWFKGKLSITILDDEGDATEEVKVVEWKDISFDQSEWKDYIKAKELNATAVVTSNITTMSEATRARKPVIAQVPESKSRARNARAGSGLAPSRGASSLRDAAEDDEDKLLPMNEEAVGKNIFAGKIFMLTSANRTTNAPIDPMFKKKNLMEFIQQNGGIVTEQLNDHLPNLEPLLISDTYYRTHKYLAALARGIPCVSNTWLQACGEQGVCVDYREYILPAGCSLFDEQDKPAPENPATLLAGKTVYVHSTHGTRERTQNGPGGTFGEIWKPILKLLGATVLEADWNTLREENIKFNVVLVDGSFREEVMQYADEIEAGKVTSEWVIQTIILGEPPEAKAHPKFDPYRLHHRNH